MCTVSFVSVNNTVVITSNRDENIQRQNAAAPAFHHLNNKKIIFPQDAKAGGTWFAACSDGNVAVLLNGAFVKHIPEPPYRKSRGLILLDIIGDEKPADLFKEIDLNNIEPFTLILYQSGSLYELRWDGSKKHYNTLNNQSNYIWSSSTLYTEAVIARRAQLFQQFITGKKNIEPESIHDFHKSDHGDRENGFVINRQTGMKTFSITQAVIGPGKFVFIHDDLLHGKRYIETNGTPEIFNKNLREEI